MDFLFMLSGAACLAETIALLMGKDFLLFYGSKMKDADYDLPRLYRAEWPLFLIDAVCCLAVGFLDLSMTVEIICLTVTFLTLLVHARFLGGSRFKK